MATLYDDFVAKVRSWSNRDSDVLPDSVIQDALDYAADTAYKTLKIAPLEANLVYTVIPAGTVATSSSQVYLETADNNGLSVVKLPIPADMSSFIHLRMKGGNGKMGVVFNEKTDVRTFWDMYADRYTGFFWSRQANFILAAGEFGEDDEIELHYYRRLPSLDARYAINATNFNAGVIDVEAIQPTTADTILYFANGTNYPPVPFTDTAYDIQNVAGDREAFNFLTEAGQELDHWLRDSNQQVILFGALYQCFDYLDDTAQSQKYKVKFMEAMDELNKSEKMLKASGGNIQMHFNSVLI
jgi:hypothetical protein